MRAGRLRHRARIERPIRIGSGEAGQPKNGWETYAQVYCDLMSVTGREAQVAEQLSPRATHVAVIRHRDGVDATMRLVVNGVGEGRDRVLHIDAVMDPRNRRDEMHLLCAEAPPVADPTGVAP